MGISQASRHALLARLIGNARQQPLLAAWIAFALYSALASIAVQFLVFPYLLPGIHGGHGLLVNTDSIGYHQIASQLATQIEKAGWSAWTLAPENQTAAGLAAPFYVLLAHEPWSVIPLNSALHATGGLIVIYFLRLLGVGLSIAITAGALWIGFPSTMQWVSQIQKDSFYFAGMLGVALGWLLLLRSTRRDLDVRHFWAGLAVLGAGVVLVFAARFYGLQIIQILTIGLACIAIPVMAYKCLQGRLDRLRSVLVAVVLVAAPVALNLAPRDVRIDAELPPAVETPETTNYFSHVYVRQYWQRTEFLPAAIDRAILRIVVARAAYNSPVYAAAGSSIDADERILDVGAFMMYLPRALQIGFLAPFPSHWGGTGVTPGGGVMRKFAGLEMLLLYPMLLIGLPLAVWRWRQTWEFWLITAFCCAIIIVNTYATPNVGSLYRLRYGFLMTLAAIGFAALCMRIADYRAQRNI